MENKPDVCPKCGSDKGVVANGAFAQYYTWGGEPNGYTLHSTAATVRCIHCGYKTNIKKLDKERENG